MTLTSAASSSAASSNESSVDEPSSNLALKTTLNPALDSAPDSASISDAGAPSETESDQPADGGLNGAGSGAYLPKPVMRRAGFVRNALGTTIRALLVVFLLYTVFAGARLGLYGYAAYQNGRELASLYRQSGGRSANGGLIVAAYPRIQELHSIARGAHATLRGFTPIFHMVGILPWIGETGASVPRLMQTGREVLDVGMGFVDLLHRTAAAEPQSTLIDIVAGTLANQRDEIHTLATDFTAIRAGLDQIHAPSLLAFAQAPMAQLQSSAHLMEAGLYFAPEIPALAGLNGPRTYLLLVQNNHELRATGGFISAIGHVTLNGGEIGELTIEDSYRIANRAVDHPFAPEPMQRYMDIELIFVRDANWSPDFPTTAALVSALYTQNTDNPVDGVIAIDLYAVEWLVRAIGPLAVEGAEVPLTGDNFVEQMIRFWESPIETGDTLESAGLGQWWHQRKDFMPAVAEAALDKLRSGRVNPLALAHSAIGALDSGAIQVWFATRALNEVPAAFGWSGQVAAEVGADFLAVVDTNLGYNKVDAVLTRGVDYDVRWEGVRAVATLTLTYAHPTPAPGHVCDPEPRYGDNYLEMTARCYFNYVRVYVPRGSELLHAEGVDADSLGLQPQNGPNNTDVFGGYFVMQPGTTHHVQWVYSLPESITPENYQLIMRRQAGTAALPVQLTVAEHTLSTRLQKTHFVWQPSP